jgi:menaquinone-dependent protoporphyrinogen IX oxidase
MKILVAFSTKGGVTAESARIVAEILQQTYGHEVDLVNLKESKTPSIGPYDAIFIGTGIRLGRWYGRAKRMLKEDYGDKKVAVFISACSAGDPAKHDEALGKYVTKKLIKHPRVVPVAVGAFGGRMKMGGKQQVDTYDPGRVRKWTMDVGKLL